MIRTARLALTLIAFCLAACSPFDETAPRTLSGSLSVGEPVRVQDGTVAIVELLPIGAQDEAVAQASLVLEDTELPIGFSLEVDPALLDTDQGYGVRAALAIDGELRWLSALVPVNVRQLNIDAGEIRLDPFNTTAPSEAQAPAAPEEAFYLCGDIPVIVTRTSESASLSVADEIIALGAPIEGQGDNVVRHESEDGSSWFEDAGATARYQVRGEAGPDCIRLF